MQEGSRMDFESKLLHVREETFHLQAPLIAGRGFKVTAYSLRSRLRGLGLRG